MSTKRLPNIVFNYDKLMTFLIKSRTRQGCLLYILLFIIVVDSQPVQKGTKKRKDTRIEKGGIKIAAYLWLGNWKNVKELTGK